MYFGAWLLAGLFLAGTLGFSSLNTAGTACSEIRVKFAGNPSIRLGENDLVRMAKASDPALIGKKLTEIDTEAIERQLNKNKTIRKADAYTIHVCDSTGIRGILVLKISHREPVVRVISPQGNYYMDREGNKIPVSTRYTVRLPLITGNPGAGEGSNGLLSFVETIRKDKFWSAQIKQIHVNGNGDLLLTTLVGNQLIEFGPPENSTEKLRNLKAFYQQILTQGNWHKYSRINLKYKNQIIAKKIN